MAEAIASVIGCSQRTVIVLTENYLSNEWCRYELQSALSEASIEKSHRLIAIVLDPKCLLKLDPEMRAALTGAGSGSLQSQAQMIYGAQQGNNNGNHNNNSQQLIQVDQSDSINSKQQRQLSSLVAMLSADTIGSPVQQIHTKTCKNNQEPLLAQCNYLTTGNGCPSSSKYISFLNYNERKFWLKLKQLLPIVARPSAMQTHTLTLTTKN